MNDNLEIRGDYLEEMHQADLDAEREEAWEEFFRMKDAEEAASEDEWEKEYESYCRRYPEEKGKTW